MLDLESVDLEQLAEALSEQGGGYGDHRWLIDPGTGEMSLWTEDGGLDGAGPVDLDDVDLVAIDPLPSRTWYQDMADFADGLSDEQAGRRLERALRGRGAFRRFKDELYEEYPELLSAWHVFRDARALNRAVEWLHDNALVANADAVAFVASHPDPPIP